MHVNNRKKLPIKGQLSKPRRSLKSELNQLNTKVYSTVSLTICFTAIYKLSIIAVESAWNKTGSHISMFAKATRRSITDNFHSCSTTTCTCNKKILSTTYDVHTYIHICELSSSSLLLPLSMCTNTKHIAMQWQEKAVNKLNISSNARYTSFLRWRHAICRSRRPLRIVWPRNGNARVFFLNIVSCGRWRRASSNLRERW